MVLLLIKQIVVSVIATAPHPHCSVPADKGHEYQRAERFRQHSQVPLLSRAIHPRDGMRHLRRDCLTGGLGAKGEGTRSATAQQKRDSRGLNACCLQDSDATARRDSDRASRIGSGSGSENGQVGACSAHLHTKHIRRTVALRDSVSCVHFDGVRSDALGDPPGCNQGQG